MTPLDEDDNDLLSGLGGMSKVGGAEFDVSAIRMDDPSSSQFPQFDEQLDGVGAMSQANASQTPGSTSLMSQAQPSVVSKKLLSEASIYEQMQGEFSVLKGYGGDIGNQFSVNFPLKPKGQDHYVYTVFGVDKEGPFEVQRRFKEFYLLRQVLVTRFLGLYVPPIPPKKTMVSLSINHSVRRGTKTRRSSQRGTTS